MNKLYTLFLSCLIITSHSIAQSGGTYTAIQAGNWHTASGPGIWQGSEPPANCNSCLIQLTAPGQYILNTSVTISNGSKIVLGDGSSLTQLLINSSNGNSPVPTTFAQGYNIIMSNTGTESVIQVAANALVSAGNSGTYDGILVVDASNTSTKLVGVAPAIFVGNTPTTYTSVPAAYGATLNGAANLSSSGTLPIVIASFTGSLSSDQVQLSWTTAEESNSDHFTVLRSTNAGSSWDSIGTVEAAGTSATAINYSFTDSKLPSGTLEYRLQLVDKDGSYKYSSVVAIQNGAITGAKLSPNPARDYVNVAIEGSSAITATVRVFSQVGQMLSEKTVSNAGGTLVALSVSGYSEGNYIVVVTGSDGSKVVSKLVVTR